MEQLLSALASAIAWAAPVVVAKLIEKGVVEPGIKPYADQVQARATSGQRNEQLRRALVRAIEDASDQAGEALAVEYARRQRLQTLVEPGNELLCAQVMRRVFLAASDDPALVPESLLADLHMDLSQRPALARFIYYLRRHLHTLEDFAPLLDAAHQQAVEAALGEMSFDLSALSQAVETTTEGSAVRVRIVESWDPKPYLRYLANECNRLRLSAIDPQYVTLTGESRITLAQVYTDLEVETRIPKKASAKNAARGLGDETRRMTALEAVSGKQTPHVALLGAPGAGKSTFANHIVFSLAMAALEPDKGWLKRLDGWPLGVRLPVRVVLRDLAVWMDANAPGKPTAQTIWSFVRHDLAENGVGESFEPLKKTLQESGGLIVFDGLDEVPDAEARREFVKTAIEAFARGCGLGRIVVTCRPYAYRDPQWRLDGFREHTLAPFSEEQIASFVHRWYETVAPLQGWSAAVAEIKAAELVSATRQPYLAELADRPLLLTLMATLHAARGKLPDDRADLYEECVALMLDYWQRGKDTVVRGYKQTEDGVLSALGLPRDQLESALARVAFEAHRRQGLQADRKPETANITGEELRQALAPALGNSLDRANTVIRYVQTRAGLLAEHGPDTYAFPHRTFQEFLAACYVLDSEDFPANLAEWVCADRDWWREVFLLAAGRGRRHGFGQAVALINALCDREYREGENVTDADAAAAALAARAAAEIRLPEKAVVPGRYQATLRKLQNWLVGIVNQGALPLVERAEVGRLLSALGDLRPDVSCPVPALVTVPAGKFVMGSDKGEYDDEKPQHRVVLSAYRIGKYPVTNAQYRQFVEDGGYSDKHRDCWTEGGWAWRESEKRDQPDFWNNSEWNLNNHPVVGVTWYEAVAYCNWLTKTDPQKRVLRLPTEAEWEKAARGDDAREYPWVGKFDGAKANTAESGIGHTTAVGLFPRGESPYHALDMAGNVWEWCADWYDGDYYGNSAAKNPAGPDSGTGRVLRGGSWGSSSDYARCAFRINVNPDNRDISIGFRVAESFPGVGSES